MPSIAMKRPAAAPATARTAAAAAKKQKVTKAPVAKEIKKPVEPAVVRDERVVEVEAGLWENEHLNAEAREMLCSMSDLVLLTPKEDRPSEMTSIVELFEKTLKEVSSKYESDLAAKLAQVDETNASKEQTESRLAELTEKMTAHKDVFMQSKNKMADVARAYRAARESLTEAERKAAQAEEDTRNAVALKEDLTTVKTDNLALLIENPQHEEASSKANLLLSVARRANLDDSLLNSLPTTLAKASADRGAFDRMVLSQCEKEMATKIETLGEEITSADAKQATLKAEVVGATSLFAEAKEAQINEAAAFLEVQEESNKRQAAVEEAQKLLVELSDKAQLLLKNVTTIRTSIDAFESGAMAAFNKLKNLEKPAPVVEEPVAEAAAATTEELPAVEEAAGQVATETETKEAEEEAPAAMEVTREEAAVAAA